MACHKLAEEDRYQIEEDINIEDADNDLGAIDFPSNIRDIREMEIGGPLGIGDQLTTLSSDKLSDPPTTQVSGNKTESNDDKVIPSSYPPEASTSIQVPTTAPTSTQSSIRSRKHTRKFKSQHARDITIIKAKEQHRKQREAKANRTGTSRTKAAEALAQTSQLLNSVELPFHSSQ
jgi:hypothetical protein